VTERGCWRCSAAGWWRCRRSWWRRAAGRRRPRPGRPSSSRASWGPAPPPCPCASPPTSDTSPTPTPTRPSSAQGTLYLLQLSHGCMQSSCCFVYQAQIKAEPFLFSPGFRSRKRLVGSASLAGVSRRCSVCMIASTDRIATGSFRRPTRRNRVRPLLCSSPSSRPVHVSLTGVVPRDGTHSH
jgi:hypothetical protein